MIVRPVKIHAIESYYSHAANKTFDGKPSAAALEASLLEEDVFYNQQ